MKKHRIYFADTVDIESLPEDTADDRGGIYGDPSEIDWDDPQSEEITAGY